MIEAIKSTVMPTLSVLSVRPSVCLSVCLSVYLSVCPYRSVCPTVNRSIEQTAECLIGRQSV